MSLLETYDESLENRPSYQELPKNWKKIKHYPVIEIENTLESFVKSKYIQKFVNKKQVIKKPKVNKEWNGINQPQGSDILEE